MHLRNSHALALIDFVVVVVKSDITSESKFRPIKNSILAIAAKQIQLYKKLDNGPLSLEDEDENQHLGTDDEESGELEESGPDSDGNTDSDF